MSATLAPPSLRARLTGDPWTLIALATVGFMLIFVALPLAELARRGIEYILSVYATDSDTDREWHPPMPRKLGWKGLSDAEIKAEAQRTHLDGTLSRKRKG